MKGRDEAAAAGPSHPAVRAAAISSLRRNVTPPPLVGLIECRTPSSHEGLRIRGRANGLASLRRHTDNRAGQQTHTHSHTHSHAHTHTHTHSHTRTQTHTRTHTQQLPNVAVSVLLTDLRTDLSAMKKADVSFRVVLPLGDSSGSRGEQRGGAIAQRRAS